jgi:hypothetical protein
MLIKRKPWILTMLVSSNAPATARILIRLNIGKNNPDRTDSGSVVTVHEGGGFGIVVVVVIPPEQLE